jgi:cobalt-zinc-cadmium resistance protein CzcA
VQVETDLQIAQKQLQTLLHTTDDIKIADNRLVMQTWKGAVNAGDISLNPTLLLQQKNLLDYKQQVRVEKQKLMPGLIVGFNNQTFNTAPGYSTNQRFNSFEVGIAVPLFFRSNRAKIRAMTKNVLMAQTQLDLITHQVESESQKLYMQYQKLQNTLNYYQNEAMPEAKLIVENSKQGFRNGDISYTQYLQNISLANDIQLEYLEHLLDYNQTIASLEAIYNNR